MLGDIVHNEDVIKQVEQAGIRRIKRLEKGAEKYCCSAPTVPPRQSSEQARQRGYRIVDATCPMVKGIHNVARKMEQEGYAIIIIGDREHDEVHGIVGQLQKKPVIIDRTDAVPHRRLQKLKKAAVVVQSTQNAENVLKIIDVIKEDVGELKFFNTICRPTRIRQAEIRTMPRENDVMVIIGSRTSANTQRLCEISHSLNSRTHCVESKRDLNAHGSRVRAALVLHPARPRLTRPYRTLSTICGRSVNRLILLLIRSATIRELAMTTGSPPPGCVLPPA